MSLIRGQSGCCQIYMSGIAASIESNSEPIEANNRLSCQRLLDLAEPHLTWFHREGLPDGKLGRQLVLVYEVKVINMAIK